MSSGKSVTYVPCCTSEAEKSQGAAARGILTPRDALACLWICEQGCMTVDQLWRAVWWSDQSRGPRYAYERVLFLERSGFLVRVKTPYSAKAYFRATRLAQELASELSEGSGLIPLQAPPITEIRHADRLTELRLLVHRAGKSVSWKPDRVLSIDSSFPRERFYSHLPDALWVTRSGRRVALEYERTRKGSTRLRLKAEALTRELSRPDRAIDVTLWIAEPGAYRDLEKVLGAHPNQRLRSFEQFKNELLGDSETESSSASARGLAREGEG